MPHRSTISDNNVTSLNISQALHQQMHSWNGTDEAPSVLVDPTSSRHLSAEAEVTQAAVNSDSPMDVALTILIVFILSPLIICGNSLLLAAFRRFKRLRTPSNCLIASLAVADLGVGLFLPLGAYFELTQSAVDSALVCLLPYCTIISICSVSILSMTSIALDRYASLAQPLRYPNIITKTSVGRYVAMFWVYGLLLGSAPLVGFFYYSDTILEPGGPLDDPISARFVCSFNLVGHHVQIFLFCMLFAPCAVVVLFSYFYVYIVARYHAHAIYSVELSVRQNNVSVAAETSQQHRSNSLASAGAATIGGHHHTFHPRYGRTLAITVGFFLLLWSPLQVCLLMDALTDAGHEGFVASKWTRIYLAFVAFSNSAFNPWVYGYRNAEFRLAFQRILEDLFSKLGVTKKQDLLHANGLALHSCASNVRLCVSPNHLTVTSLLRPSYVQGQDNTTSCANGDGPSTTVVICETVISTEIH